MWASPRADVGQVGLLAQPCTCLVYISMNVAWCVLQRRCAMKHHSLHRCRLQRSGRARLCALRCGWRGVGSAVVSRSIGVQPEHRQLEDLGSEGHVLRTRPCAVAHMQRATEVLLAAVVPAQMWARPAQMWARLGSTMSESCAYAYAWQLGATSLLRWSTTRCIVVCCNAMYGAAAWRGTAGALGSVRCGVDGVGSARQAFYKASAFNQNIGSWNTFSLQTLGGAFTDVGLADCIKRSVYDNWGSTLRAAYPLWSSLCSPSPTPRCEGRSAAMRALGTRRIGA